MVIEKKISRQDVGKEMNKVLKREIKNSLSSSEGVEVPDWVLDRVLEFCEPWFPFVRAPKTISSLSSKLGGMGSEKDKDKDEWIVNPMENDQLEDIVDFMQDFYSQLEDYLRVELGGSSESGSGGEEKGAIEVEVKIRGIMELVERTVCSLFYDRYVLSYPCLRVRPTKGCELGCSRNRRRTTLHMTRHSLIGSRHSTCWTLHSNT